MNCCIIESVYLAIKCNFHYNYCLQIINVEYQADENGFRVHGDHLPTPPPVSPEIQKGLDLIYAGIRLQEERRKNNPNYAIDEAERKRLNYLGLYIGN